jgi:hypothetical protein
LLDTIDRGRPRPNIFKEPFLRKKRKEENENEIKTEIKSIGYSLCLSLLNERPNKTAEHNKLSIRNLRKIKIK